MRTKSVSALLFVLLLVGSSISFADNGFPRSCAGTYLIQEGGGAKSLWTLEADGAFLATSSAQPSFNFSNQQGVWDKDGNRGAKAVLLDFSFDGSGTLINIGRVDIAIHTVGGGCANVAGTLSLRFFEAGEDPLNPSTDTGSAITDTFTGRRLTLGH
jgi:hypothetical protein